MNARRVTVKEEKSPYIIYYPSPCYQLPPIGSDIPDEGCQTVSIDIGWVNFAIRIEVRYRGGLIKPIYFSKIDFTQYGTVTKKGETTGVDPQILNAILDLLKTLLPTMQDTRIVGIERQLGFVYQNTRIFQHVLTFFMLYASSFKYPCIVMDIDSRLKSRMLNAPKGLRGNDLKQWAIEKAIEILGWRNDLTSIQMIRKDRRKTKTKGDDLSDTVIQMEAWFLLNNGIVTTAPQILYLDPSPNESTADFSNNSTIELVLS